MMPNHSPSAIHSWRERRYPPSDPNEKVQKMREAQHGRRDPTLVPMPSAPIQDALDQLDEDGDVEAPVPGALPTKKKKRSR